MALPNTYTDINETGCCPIPNVTEWDKQKFKFTDQHFIREFTKSFFHMPLNMGSVMKKLNKTATQSGHALPDNQTMILSKEISPWKAEQLYSVSEPVHGADNVVLHGEFISLVFEGPYKEAKNWMQELENYVTNEGEQMKDAYFFYTTCPKCAKHYGKNYVIGLAKI